MTNKKVKSYRGAVMTWECDSNDHMNVMYYINKYENGGRNFSHEIGLTNEYIKEHNLGIAVVKQEIDYIQEVFEDDLLYVESSLEKLGGSSFIVLHEMKNVVDDSMVGKARMTLVCFDKEKRKAVPIAPEIKSKMTEYL